MSSHRSLTTGNSLIRSRWALAASVSLLLLGSLLLPSRFSQDSKPESSVQGPHISSGLRPQMERDHRNRQIQNQNKPGLAAEDDDQRPEMDDSELPLQ